jgi:hypothetical protein
MTRQLAPGGPVSDQLTDDDISTTLHAGAAATTAVADPDTTDGGDADGKDGGDADGKDGGSPGDGTDSADAD